MSRQGGLVDSGPRLNMHDSIVLTLRNLETYGSRYPHWAIAYSGGKDSTAAVTFVLWAIWTAMKVQAGDKVDGIQGEVLTILRSIRVPRSITVCYADTRMELTPLALNAMALGEEIECLAQAWAEDGLSCELSYRVVCAPLDLRYLVYMLGRGVPPSNNATMRWCTPKIKIEPMSRALMEVACAAGLGRMVPRKGKSSSPTKLTADVGEEAGAEFILEDEATGTIYRGFDHDVMDNDEIWSGLDSRLRSMRRLMNRKFKPRAPKEGMDPVEHNQLEADRRNVFEAQQEAARGAVPQLEIELRQREQQLIQSPRKLLVLTGVRRGESAVRDQRIYASCTTDRAECGQGWFQRDLPGSVADTLAPLDHWRICHVWEWLWGWAPLEPYGGWSTRLVAEAYGGRDGNEAADLAARTGCIGCPLVQEDVALENLIKLEQWAYLAPLRRLREIYVWLRLPRNRLRKAELEFRKDGKPVTNPNRMGPIVLTSRLEALEQVLAIQLEVNTAAERLGRPRIDILNAEEELRVRELIAAETWPDKWAGTEPRADELVADVFRDGTSQPLLDLWGK